GLKPGMTSNVRILVGRRGKGLRVPIQSGLEGRRGGGVFRQGRKGKRKRGGEKTPGKKYFFWGNGRGKNGEEEGREPRAGERGAVAVLAADVESAAPRPARVLVRSVRLPSESVGRRARIDASGLTIKDLERIKALPDVTRVVPVRMFPMETRRLDRMTLGPVI